MKQLLLYKEQRAEAAKRPLPPTSEYGLPQDFYTDPLCPRSLCNIQSLLLYATDFMLIPHTTSMARRIFGLPSHRETTFLIESCLLRSVHEMSNTIIT